MIFPCLYHAPIVYYALLLADPGDIILERHDHYTKQTYRNRCRILGGNGSMNLVVPIVKDHGNKTISKDVRIDYDTSWQPIHWKSINAAYASSPFFEYIIDSYQGLYEKRYIFLVDLNMDLLKLTLDLLNIDKQIQLSASYEHLSPDNDPRECIHPKRSFQMSNVSYEALPYQQVFNDRHGFVKDLSIIDLLFNEGQNAADLLKRSISLDSK